MFARRRRRAAQDHAHHGARRYTLKFFVGLRNKCMEAYREIMHMGS
jgi:hypothetical protein